LRPHRSLSRSGRLLEAARQPVEHCDNTAFITGLPALEAFPHRIWARLVGRAIREAPEVSLGTQPPGGCERLKQTIAMHLKLTRGVQCEPDQVLILPGAQAALYIAARMLLNPGNYAWIEDPGYLGARGALQSAGARLLAVPVDDRGMDPRNAIDNAKPSRQPALIYVTPSYQFPLGVTMTLDRRMSLLEFAHEHGVWIHEDDYDSDFRYQGRPLAALQGLDTGGRVIYTGTFSKTMFPSLRVAYLIVPRSLVQAFQAAVRVTGQETPMFVQVALHDFMENGHYRSHVRKMHRLYEARQDTFVRAARAILDNYLEVNPGEAGMQLVAFYQDGKHRPGIEELARRHGINVRCLSNYYLDRPRRRGLFLGYAAVAEREMADGIRRLRAALEDCDGGGLRR
jgi:GntR family transcriptional regulator/MocR family aminotransferase